MFDLYTVVTHDYVNDLCIIGFTVRSDDGYAKDRRNGEWYIFNNWIDGVEPDYEGTFKSEKEAWDYADAIFNDRWDIYNNHLKMM